MIFDLDDTIIDTSSCLVEKRLETALLAMKKMGFASLYEFSFLFDELKSIDKLSNSSKKAIEIFVNKYNGNASHIEIAIDEIYHAPLSKDEKINFTKGAKNFLYKAKINHTLCLVTVGDKSLQKDKLKKAGIDCSIFSKIDMITTKDKKNSYEKILVDLHYCAKDTLVCGDKIETDLMPAKELGCMTVLMRNGRGRTYTLPNRYVDHVIEKLSDINNLIREGI